ncbi:purine-cytosine permease family protein [Hwanghaeella sp. LZ110]|uniref:purine-cytosine permease family protein n=1 Tax=Hwanghaeella sp. LZ110 TaxID=3402810 RepID=UPI003B683BD0
MTDTSKDSADESNWPLVKSERTWGRIELGIVLLVAASATWCYIIGEYVGYYLNLKQGFATMTAGAMIGMLLVTLAVVPAATRYGIDSIVAARPQFGSRGWIITVFLQYASIIGWNSLLLIFFGKSVVQLLLTTGLVGEGATDVILPVATLVACAVVYGVLLTGKSGIERASNILFFFIVGVGLWMVYLLLTQNGAAVAEAKPAYASGDIQWDYVTGIEIGIVSLLSWWPYIGAMVRVAPNASTASMPAMLGMGLPVPLLSLIGLAAILALETSDPSAWMVQLGGTFYGTIALVFVIAANLGTAIIGVYATAVGLKSVPGIGKLSWKVTLLLALVPVALIGVVVPDLFFNNFGTFLAFIGVFFAPLCGIQIVDYLILRKQRLSVRGLYDGSSTAPYYYWGGFNPAALLAMAAGFVTYVYLLDPLTYVSKTPYEVLTASLPSAVIGGLVFWVLTLVLVKPAQKGGY